jgi:hypothetical protein
MAEPPRVHNQAWTKADYDKYMDTHSRTPSDAKWESTRRAVVNDQAIMVRDEQVRTQTNIKRSDRQRKYRDKKKEA